MSHKPARIRPPLCESPLGLRPPGDSHSCITNTLHMYSINSWIYASNNKINCKKLFVKNRKKLIDVYKGKLPAIYVGKKALINYEKLVYLLSSLGDGTNLEAVKIENNKQNSNERVFVTKEGDLDESKDWM